MPAPSGAAHRAVLRTGYLAPLDCGGTILSSKTRDVPSRAAQIFRIAAQSLHAAKSALGDHFRRMRARIGAPEAITATAHSRAKRDSRPQAARRVERSDSKLARIYYAVLKTRTPYDEPSEAR